MKAFKAIVGAVALVATGLVGVLTPNSWPWYIVEGVLAVAGTLGVYQAKNAPADAPAADDSAMGAN